MIYFEAITYIVVLYGAYTTFMGLRWLSNDTGNEIFAHKKYLHLFKNTCGAVLLMSFVWFVSYVGINTVHHVVAEGILPGAIEMTWRLGHLALNLALVRISQMVLYFELCENGRYKVGDRVFKLPIYYNTITRSYF